MGNATLYRHFPTRAALIEAVYDQRIAALCALAAELSRTREPGRALHEWLHALVVHITDDRVLAEAFMATRDDSDGADPPQITTWHMAIHDAAAPLLSAARSAGTIRADLDFMELMALTAAVARAADPARAGRFLDILLEGITPR